MIDNNKTKNFKNLFLDKFKYVLKNLPTKYFENDVTAFSAQMAYFLFMSIFPALIFLIGLLGRFSIEYRWDISGYISLIPRQASYIIQEHIKNLIAVDGQALFSISGIVMIYSASRGINSLMRSLNKAFDIKEDRGFIKVKLLGIFYTFVIMLSIVVALVIPNLGYGFFMELSKYVEIPKLFAEMSTLFGWVIYLVLMNIVIGSLYVFLPNRKIRYIEVIPGTIVALIGWSVISRGFSFFIANFSDISVVYGSLTAVIILMIWLYLSSTILMIGGEINSLLIEYKANRL
ncbi:MAG: YihY/virulence factor BrkB family protein [Acidaminobacteraceae bacterium]